MGSIFEIAAEYKQLLREIEEAEGELTPELAERLTINEADAELKLTAYRNFIRIKEAEIELAKEEKKRLDQAITTRENLINRLKERMIEAVKLMGYDNKSGNRCVELGVLKFTVVPTKSVDIAEGIIINEDLKPYTSIKTVTTTVFDKIAIKKAILDNNKSFDGIKIITKDSIRGL